MAPTNAAPRRGAASLLALCCLLCAAAAAVVETPQCRWDSESGVCDLSPGAMIDAFRTTTDPNNTYLVMILRFSAIEVSCNQYTTAEACAADAACEVAADQVPACRMNTESEMGETMTRAVTCPGSPAVDMTLCSAAGTNETACAAAANCTLLEGNCVSAAFAAMDETQRNDFYTAMSAYNTTVWGDCGAFKAFYNFTSSCDLPGSEEISQESGTDVITDDGTTLEGARAGRPPARSETEAGCAALGAQCTWHTTTCTTNSLAIVRFAFGAAADSAPAAAAAQCVAARSVEVCNGTGGAVTVNAEVLAALAAGNETLADGALVLPAGSDDAATNATGANTTTASTTGAAGAALPSALAAASALLLAALL